jgi:peptidoglycan/LPS O-acetylase OafA/YrhL
MKRFEALDSWRGIAACLVAACHLRPSVNSHLTDVALILNSYLFVDFFFVLSGFVIAANYEKRLAEGFSLWRFALLRFGRLYPLHLSVLLALILLRLAHSASGLGTVSAFQPPFWSADTIVANLLLVHGLHLFDFFTWNGPSWSISTEFYTYLLFALVVGLAKRRIVVLLLSVVLVSTLMLWILVGSMYTTFDWGFLRCILGFSLGVLMWHAHRALRLRSGTALELATVGLIVVFVWRCGANGFSLAAPAVFALAVLVFAVEAGAVSRLLRAPAWLWLGARSYSIYMVHSLVSWLLVDCLKLLRLGGIDLISGSRIGRQLWEGNAVYLVYLVLVVGLASVTYSAIEVPSRAWFRRLATRGARHDARTELQNAPRPGVIPVPSQTAEG